MTGSLQDKKIILGVTGSIAAYKSALLARLLVKSGAEVKVVMTPSAGAFITPLTFSTLTSNAVYTDLMRGDQWNSHVELGLWADLMIVAPATANSIAKMATGHVDNMLLAVYLSARCPVFIAPAMDLDMWKHPSTKRNMKLIQSDGVYYVPVEEGLLASGLTGKGRMAEPEHILHQIVNHFIQRKSLIGRKVLITAGPTREALDPVRFMTNPSTGTMGIALAECLAKRGAEVHLILGPVGEVSLSSDIAVYPVVSAEEMYHRSRSLFPQMNAGIMAAAVADFTPKKYSEHKIKKQGDELVLTLKRTKDIALDLGKMKKKDQYLVGFALETDDGKKAARQKLDKKNLDFIVLNSLSEPGAGFGRSTNKVLLMMRDGSTKDIPLKSKAKVAEDIVEQLCEVAGWKLEL